MKPYPPLSKHQKKALLFFHHAGGGVAFTAATTRPLEGVVSQMTISSLRYNRRYIEHIYHPASTPTGEFNVYMLTESGRIAAYELMLEHEREKNAKLKK